MAHTTNSSASMAELGGNHQNDRKLHDTPTIPRNSDQRAAVKSAQSMARSSKALSTEASSNNGDEEEDGSAAQEEEEEEEEDLGVVAPSRGKGKGKGKGPAIRVEPTDEDFEDEEDDVVANETGLQLGKHSANLMSNKKRTFSSLSSTSLLFGDDEAEKSFPRRKIARKLSTGSFKPLLKYKQNTNAGMTASEHAIESDDEDYSGVNLVPDEDDFEEEEESFIIQDELGHKNSYSSFVSQYNDSRRLSLDSHASDSIFDMTAPIDGPYTEGISLPDHGFGQFFEPEEALPASPDVSTKRKYSDSSTKRVRFDDEVEISDSSSTSSSDLDSSFYPDLFLEQDKLPASLSQLLDNEYDEDNGDYDSPGSEISFWEYQDSAPGPYTLGKAAREDDESSEPGSSGYETDEGDTTDEYESDLESDAQPQTPLQKKSVLHRPSSAPGSKVSSPQPFERSSRPTPGRAKPPVRGIFVHEDNSKAIAITNRNTNKLAFYRPRAPVTWMTSRNPYSSSNSTSNSPRTSLQQFNGSDSEISNEVFNNQFTSDIMLSGIFGGAPNNDFMFGAENMGPPEAFFPFVSIGRNGTVIEDEADYDEDDDEDDLNLAEFMDFGEGADDTDVEQDEEETDVPATPATSTVAINGSTPAHPTPRGETPANLKRDTSNAMLQHFDRGVVTAFRNNQNRYRDVACLPSDPTIRASVSKPIRSGKSAETVMTPARKTRAGPKRPVKSPFQNHASSPLSGVSKASGRLHSSALNAHPPRMGTFS